MMSLRAMTWAFGIQGLAPRDKLVLLSLADQANDAGFYAWPSVETIAHRASCSVRSVRRSISLLREAGLLSTEVRSSQSGCRGTLYQVHVGVEFSASDKQSANLALCDTPNMPEPVDNPTFPSDDTKVPDWHFAESPVENFSQSDTGGTLQSDSVGTLLPYGDLNHHKEPPSNQELPVDNSPSLESSSMDGVDGMNDSGNTSVAPRVDWELLAACLPSPMLSGLSGRGAAIVTGELQAALEAGWKKQMIYHRLNTTPLPGDVHNLAGLVIFRVRELAQTPPPHPTFQRSTPPAPEPEPPCPVRRKEVIEAEIAAVETDTSMKDFLRRALLKALHMELNATPTCP